MKRYLLALSFLSLLDHAQAEALESTVTLQFKLYRQLPDNPQGNNLVKKYQVTTLKTADIIQSISKANGKSFTHKARLVYAQDYSGVGPHNKYLIREKGRPFFDATAHFTFKVPIPLNTSSLPIMTKGKVDSTNGVGVTKTFGLSEVEIKPGAEVEFLLKGTITTTDRKFISKEFSPNQIKATSGALAGAGSFNLATPFPTPDSGVLQGTVKISPPKITPSPTIPPVE